MKLDDLLGLLFLFFFVILPAIQSILRRGRPAEPDFEEDFPSPRQEPQPKPQPRQAQANPPSSPRPSASPPAQSRPPAPVPRSAPAPVPPPSRPLVQQSRPPAPKQGKTLEQIERERLARVGSQPANQPPAQPKPKPPAPVILKEESGFSLDRRAILNGVVWHQVLGEPRGQYWRKLRKPKR